MNDAGKLLTVAEAADRSACSTKTLRRAIDAGQLKVCRLGQSAKSDRIHPDDLSTWWAQSRLAVPQFSFPEPARFYFPSDPAEERIERRLGIPGAKAAPTAKSSPKKAAAAKGRRKGAK